MRVFGVVARRLLSRIRETSSKGGNDGPREPSLDGAAPRVGIRTDPALRPAARGGSLVTILYVVGGAVAAALFVYLLVAMLKPELF